MMTSRANRRWSRLALVAGLGAVVTIGCAGSIARAQDNDDDALPDVKVLRSILHGLGLRRDGDGIDYRERSPLVLPPSQELPPPEKATPAEKTAAWPVDPDVKRAKELKEARRKFHSHVEGVDDRPLLPSEYGSKAPPRRRPGNGGAKSADESAKPLTPPELGSKGIFSAIWAPKEEYSTFAGEPPRNSLVDPPTGYRTPSPNQPYGVGKEKWKPEPFDRQVPAR
jgi:hypothetical protein